MLISAGNEHSQQNRSLMPTRPTEMQSSSRVKAILASAHTESRQQTLLQAAQSTSMHNRALVLQTWVVIRHQVAR